MKDINSDDIFGFIKTEEDNYKLPIDIDGWDWSMKDHVHTSFFYKHGRLLTGNDDDKPVKNVVKPILNMQYRATGFDVKDITLFINDLKTYFKSFLVKKYHDEVWSVKNNIDEFIDDMIESYVDYGLILLKKLKGQVAPEVVELQSIAFCDQVDVLSGPIAIEHFLSPSQLKEFESAGWGDKEKSGATISIDDLITLSQSSRKDEDGKDTHSTGKQIKIYEVHGTMPKHWLNDSVAGESISYVDQMQIVAFYQKENGDKEGVILFRGEEKTSPFKQFKRDKVFGRACGFGGAEELFEPQVWVTYGMMAKKDMLDSATKTILHTTDLKVAKRNNIKDMDNLEVVGHDKDTTFGVLDTSPRDINLFTSSVVEWEQQGAKMGSANESILGEKPSAGTPFKLQELVTAENHSLHEYRKGKLAGFTNELYRDWFIPDMVKEITRGDEFVATLTLDELEEIAGALSIQKSEEFKKEKILNGEFVTAEEIEAVKLKTTEEFMRGGDKRFIKILKDELKNAPIAVQANVVGKQKNLELMTDKLVNIFRQIIANPQVLDDPRMAKIFNQILEGSGFSPIDFGYTGYRPKTEAVAEAKAPNETPNAPESPSATPVAPAPNVPVV